MFGSYDLHPISEYTPSEKLPKFIEQLGITHYIASEEFLEYEKHRNNKLHKSVMDIIVRANERVFKEVRGSMCDALVELMQDVIDEKFAEGKLEGRIEGLLEQIRKKVAKGKTVEQIADELEESVENIQTLMDKIVKKSS